MNRKDKIREGDLVYIPSNVRLIQTHRDGSVSKYSTTEKPIGVILTKKHEQEFLLENTGKKQQETYWSNYCEVLYNSDRWLIHHRDIFKMREK
jgi:hypothetical protein